MPEEKKQITTQEVFALRKAGKLEEALGHARDLHQSDAEDEWVIRALAWCLYDEIKRLRAEKNQDASVVIEELAQLKLPNEGEMDMTLKECVERILQSGPLAQANQLSKDGNHHDAVALIRPIAKAEGASQYEIEAYAWILYRKLKECGEKETDAAVWCLTEFLNCWSSECAPNTILFKCMLIQAKIHVENWASLIPLVEKLELHKLSPADFVDDQSDSDFDSFQDQLLGAVHKCLKKHPAMRQPRPQLQLWLDAWADSFSDDQWPQYHLGHILLWTDGDKARAKLLLLKTVQRNPGDYWRWQALAEALDGAEQKAAMARGIICKTEDPSFMVPLYKDFANLLAAEQALPEATASLNEAIRLRKLSGNEWRDPLPAWHTANEGKTLPDIHEYAKPFAAKADELLAADLPSRLCVLIRPLQKEGRFLYLCPNAETRTLKFRKDQSPPAEIGAIEAQFEDKESGVCIVLAWKEADTPTDLGVSEPGVVTHINPNKKLTSVTTPTQGFIPLFFDRWHKASELKPGMFVELQYVNLQDSKPNVLKWVSIAPKRIPEFTIPVHGSFELARDKAFGFIEMQGEKIFVAPEEATILKGSATASGWAMRSNDKHGRPSWKLLPQNQ
jgi:hypothetical protein